MIEYKGHGILITIAFGVVALALSMIGFSYPGHADAVCSVLSGKPCLPTQVFCSVLDPESCASRRAICSVFSDEPCAPDIDYPYGQDLKLTIVSRSSDIPAELNGRNKIDHAAEPQTSHDLKSIRDVFSTLRACWIPPAKSDARKGTQISVRLSFKRNGDMLGPPRLTYMTPDTPNDVRKVYWDAVVSTLKRCVPLIFTNGLGGALAGRPFAIRFVDERS